MNISIVFLSHSFAFIRFWIKIPDNGPETLSGFSENTVGQDSLNLDDISLHQFDGTVSDVSKIFNKIMSIYI